MNMASSSSVLFFLLLVPSLASEKRKVAEESNLGVENASLCSSGKSQSPIDIITSETFINKSLEPLTRNYHVFNASLLTDGKHLQVPFSVRGGLIIDGKTYNLKQMHWHTPSEHRINGIQYAAELHEVHIAADGSATVVGILFEEGPPSPLLTMVKTISKDQVALLKATVCGANKENARPTQPLNGRIVQKYDGN
uniref:Carbonic anhydrase n=1 Tax=Opuntia streptacantha TaxID=393608 RepID=A0A7C9DUP9_OPUST